MPAAVDIIPAIDIRVGQVVRLVQGDTRQQMTFDGDPVQYADGFAAAGARWIHVIDLDQAFGEGDNSAIVSAIVARVAGRARVQVGGGCRSLDRVRALLDVGVSRVIIGTVAIIDPTFVSMAVSAVGGEQLVVGIDTRMGKVAIHGWTEFDAVSPATLARRVAGEGIGTVIYTDIGRDGMLDGPDVDGAVALQAEGASVIVSGGASSLSDVEAVRDSGLAGMIVGRALYAGRFTLAEALAVARA